MTPRLNNNIYSQPHQNSRSLYTSVSITQRVTAADGIPRRGPVVYEPRGSVIKAGGCKTRRPLVARRPEREHRLRRRRQLLLLLRKLTLAAVVHASPAQRQSEHGSADTGSLCPGLLVLAGAEEGEGGCGGGLLGCGEGGNGAPRRLGKAVDFAERPRPLG